MFEPCSCSMWNEDTCVLFMLRELSPLDYLRCIAKLMGEGEGQESEGKKKTLCYRDDSSPTISLGQPPARVFSGFLTRSCVAEKMPDTVLEDQSD